VPGVTIDVDGIVMGMTIVGPVTTFVPPTDSSAVKIPSPLKSIHICTLNVVAYTGDVFTVTLYVFPITNDTDEEAVRSV
jgi:hypothetical protein